MLTVRIAGKPWNLTLIQVRAPTNQATDQEKDEFYTCLQQVYNQVPKQDIGGVFFRRLTRSDQPG